MLASVRFFLAKIRPQITRTRGAIATAARRALSAAIVGGIGLAVTALVALSAVICVAGCPAPTPANGAISIAWSIRATSGVAVSCDRAGAAFVALRIRNRGSGGVTATAFPCANSPGTAQLAPGIYDVSFQLDAADGTRLATSPDQTGVSVLSGQVRPLAPVTFAITAGPETQLVLNINAGTTTNCGPTSAGGAGITGSTVTLEAVGGGCAAVTFTRQRTGEPRGTYTVNCSSPVVAPCLEKDETLTTSLASGSYRLHVGGKVGTLDCWQRDDIVEIPAQPAAVIRNLSLQRTNGPGC